MSSKRFAVILTGLWLLIHEVYIISTLSSRAFVNKSKRNVFRIWLYGWYTIWIVLFLIIWAIGLLLAIIIGTMWNIVEWIYDWIDFKLKY